MARITITHADWLKEAGRRCSGDFRKLRFVCPCCGHVQTPQDFFDLGQKHEDVEARAGFSCIGRWMPTPPRDAFDKQRPGPCNYAGGGLFQLNPVAVDMGQGEPRLTFDFADEPLCDVAAVPGGAA